jgi:hypothetical protein
VAAALSIGVSVADPPESPSPQDAVSKTPITDSIEPAIERFVRERLSRCGGAQGVPCFPVTVEVEGRRYSVREGLENLEFDSRPVPGAPLTAADMIRQGANPRPTSGSVGFDPGAIVCKTRQLIRKIQGKSRKYYLYRVWDETGERALLRDEPMDPDAAAGSPHLRYLALGEFGDECEAIRAYLRSTHRIRARRAAVGAQPATPPGLERRSGDAPE